EIDALVLEGVYPTLREAVDNRIRMRVGRLLSKFLTPALLVQLKPRLGFSAAALRPIEGIRSIGAPVLIMAGSHDAHTTLKQSRRLFEAAAQPRELWVLDGATHVDFHQHAGEEYEARVLNFFDRYLR
ncbi:MAG: alpha/beta hydrolase, partial [Planctomycetota bacterium]